MKHLYILIILLCLSAASVKGQFMLNRPLEIHGSEIIFVPQGGHYLLDGSELIIKGGGRFEIESCATLEIINGGRLVIETGAEICIHPGAFFVIESMDNLHFEPGFSFGGCPAFDPENFEQEIIAHPPAYSVSGTVVWDDKVYNFTEDLYIEPGARLTISGNSIMRFGPDKKIIVGRSAILIVDNSEITNLCHGNRWRGIEVWGDHNKSQLPDAQGNMHQARLIVRNGAVISNAVIAAIAGKTNPAFDYGNGYSEGTPTLPIVDGFAGGMIMARDSEFRNNLKSIYLTPYENFHHSDPQTPRNNLSYAVKCDFVYNQDMIKDEGPETFIHLVGVRGIKLKANSFVNESLPLTETGAGIISLNSSFIVEKACANHQIPCSHFRLSRFENLHYGIKALGAATAKTFTVDTAMFIHNITGIYTNSINNF